MLGLTDADRAMFVAAARQRASTPAAAPTTGAVIGPLDLLLATKLFRPRTRPGLVERVRLLDRLKHGARTVLTLLRQAHDHGIMPDYVAKLLAAFGYSMPLTPHQPHASEAWIEPLTEREREVLLLLATGASNSEIARHLF